MEMNKTKTDRGFLKFTFDDRYGQVCSIQKSSLAGEDAIWLGVENTGPNIHGQRTDAPNEAIMARMHLTQEQVKELLPLLKNFVKTGDL